MIWLWVTLAVILDGSVAFASALVPERWLDRHRSPMLGFAAGALVACALGDILPDALAANGAIAVLWIALALAVLGLFQWKSARRANHRHPILPRALLGSDALHNLGDGMAIAAAFLVGPRVGAITSIAVIAHELPEEIADYLLLRAAGMPKRRALLALAAVQLTAGIGAAATLLGSSLFARGHGIVLAIACALFLYIAIVLLPHLRSWAAVVGACAGAALVLLL